MKIGIDGIPLSREKTGVGNYVYYHLLNLIKIRKNDLFIIYSPREHLNFDHFRQFNNVIIKVAPFFQVSDALWSQTTLAYLCFRDKIEIFWGTSQSVPLFTFHKYKKVITIYDFAYLFFPETVSTIRRLYLKYFSRLIYFKTDIFTVISKQTGCHLQQLYGINTWEIIYPPLKEIPKWSESELQDFLDEKDLEYNDYLVTLGTLEPRKNLLEVVHAYEKILTQYSLKEVRPLILIGGSGWKNQNLIEKIKDLKKRYPTHLRAVGYVDDENTSKFLTGAAYFIMFSKYEGYGMPIAEARSCNTKVVCSDKEEMREAAENDAVFVKENFNEIFREISLKKNKKAKEKIDCQYKKNSEIAACLSSIFDSHPY